MGGEWDLVTEWLGAGLGLTSEKDRRPNKEAKQATGKAVNVTKDWLVQEVAQASADAEVQHPDNPDCA